MIPERLNTPPLQIRLEWKVKTGTLLTSFSTVLNGFNLKTALPIGLFPMEPSLIHSWYPPLDYLIPNSTLPMDSEGGTISSKKGRVITPLPPNRIVNGGGYGVELRDKI